MSVVWVDGVFREADDDSLGIGVFETIGAHGGQLPLWERHLARLRRGARSLGLPFSPVRALAEDARALLERCGEPNGVLRVTLTATRAGARWTMTVRAREPAAPVRLWVAAARRSPSDPTIGLKTTSRAFWHLLAEQARAAGCDDALLLDTDGCICETTIANVWFLADGAWHTPAAARCLPGIARAVLLDALRARGARVAEGDHSLDTLRASDAIFVTNAVRGPRPALLDGGPPLPTGEPLAALWREALELPPRSSR